MTRGKTKVRRNDCSWSGISKFLEWRRSRSTAARNVPYPISSFSVSNCLNTRMHKVAKNTVVSKPTEAIATKKVSINPPDTGKTTLCESSHTQTVQTSGIQRPRNGRGKTPPSCSSHSLFDQATARCTNTADPCPQQDGPPVYKLSRLSWLRPISAQSLYKKVLVVVDG